MNKGLASVFLLIAIVVALFVSFVVIKNNKNEGSLISTGSELVETSTPTPYQFPYKNPTITKNNSYRIIIVGDSIVGALGPNANTLRLELIKRYPDSEFVTYNYGYGATNILTLPDRLTKTTKNGAEEHPPILTQGFELIIIESFGYNPLSELSLSDGLAKQTQILETSIQLILQKKPDAALAFMTPIALSRIDFAKGTYDINEKTRNQWVDERIAYIENHKKFAEEKGIPVIDVYKASLKLNGQVDKIYIGGDSIHPSWQGIDLISQTIATYIYDNQIFPK